MEILDLRTHPVSEDVLQLKWLIAKLLLSLLRTLAV